MASVEALLARLREAQERTEQATEPQNDSHHQYQQNANPHEQPNQSASYQGFSPGVATPTTADRDPSTGGSYEQHAPFYIHQMQDQQHQYAIRPPDVSFGQSVHSLLNSLQSSRDGTYLNPALAVPPSPHTQYRYEHRPHEGYFENHPAPQSTRTFPDRGRHNQMGSITGGSSFSGGYHNPQNRQIPPPDIIHNLSNKPQNKHIQPLAGTHNLAEKPMNPETRPLANMPQRPETESSIEHFREQANKSPRKVPETSIPPSPVPPVVPIPAQPARYDPYNEDFEDKPGFEITPLQGHDDGPLESDHESAGEDKEMTMNTEEEEQVRLVAQRNSDEFVNLAYAQALPIITQLLNEDAVMRRLKELKAEQDKMERQLWDKRLDIVKIHRARMNKAKEGATRLDTRAGDLLIQKERSAATKALRQYYTSRCLPFFDDLHRRHLKIMQEELGIPGLGRLETRRKKPLVNNAAAAGRADRVITIDSDDDEVKEKEVSDLVGEGLTEEEREKTLARRRKIMSVIESVMSDTMDQ